MNDIDYLAIDELLTEIYIPIENKSKRSKKKQG